MKRKKTARGDVIATLNQLVREGVITSFRTNLFDKETAAEPDIAVGVANTERCEETVQEVLQALEPLGVKLSVVADLGGRPGEGCP